MANTKNENGSSVATKDVKNGVASKTIEPAVNGKQKALSLEEKLIKIDSLITLKEKRERLKEVSTQISRFKMAAERGSVTLQLKDASNSSLDFRTANTEVVEKAIQVVADTVEVNLSSVEQQIDF